MSRLPGAAEDPDESDEPSTGNWMYVPAGRRSDDHLSPELEALSGLLRWVKVEVLPLITDTSSPRLMEPITSR